VALSACGDMAVQGRESAIDIRVDNLNKSVGAVRGAVADEHFAHGRPAYRGDRSIAPAQELLPESVLVAIVNVWRGVGVTFFEAETSPASFGIIAGPRLMSF
jgi:hypothetical protein